MRLNKALGTIGQVALIVGGTLGILGLGMAQRKSEGDSTIDETCPEVEATGVEVDETDEEERKED